MTRFPSHIVREKRYQRLSEPEREGQLRSSHQQLWCQALEEAQDTLVLEHVGYNPHTAFRVLEIPVLNTSLDDVERCRDNDG